MTIQLYLTSSACRLCGRVALTHTLVSVRNEQRILFYSNCVQCAVLSCVGAVVFSVGTTLGAFDMNTNKAPFVYRGSAQNVTIPVAIMLDDGSNRAI